MAELSGSTIRAYRKRLSLNQGDFAQRLNLSPSLVSAVEVGRTPVSARLLRALRTQGEAGAFQPSFDEFLSEGGVGGQPLEQEFGLVRQIVLETWRGRVDLRESADLAGSDRLAIPAMPSGARAYRFAPPPSVLAPSTVAVFKPCRLQELQDERVVLVQFRGRRGLGKLKSGQTYVGRMIVTGRGKNRNHQFQSSSKDVPIITVHDQMIDILMVCFFQGQYNL